MSAPIISIDHATSTGYLDIMFGPMFSGKTTSLLSKLNVFTEMDVKTLYVTHSLDTRGETYSTHNRLLIKSDTPKFDFARIEHVSELLDEKYNDYLVIGIDEAQFFTDLKDSVLKLVEEKGKRVVVAGLSSNFKREPFGEIFSLLPYCDEVTKLKALCKECTKQKKLTDAHFSYRITQTKENILIGGFHDYVPLCRSCFLSQE